MSHYNMTLPLTLQSMQRCWKYNTLRENKEKLRQLIRWQSSQPRFASKLTEATNADSKQCMQVKWGDGGCSEYPYVWMRDNCQCPSCFHPVSMARLVLMQDVDLNIKPKQIKVLENGEVDVLWPDGHKSVFQQQWLKERSFTEKEMDERDKDLKQSHTFWYADTIKSVLPAATHASLMTSEEAMYEWLSKFQKYGLALVNEAPGQGSLMELAKKIAFPKTTHYGDTFTVKTKVDPSNVAYTGARLGLHTDLTYYDYHPGIQFLHCIKQCAGEGGDNQFVDGFSVANYLKENYPEYYKILSTAPLDHWDFGEDYTQFFKVLREPVFRLNHLGNVCQIRYNNQVRDSYLRADPATIVKIYEAMKAFDDQCYSKRFKLEMKLQDGQIIVFDNRRVLHGRNGFTTSESSQRTLEGTYIDWDECLSTLRFLRKKLNKTD